MTRYVSPLVELIGIEPTASRVRFLGCVILGSALVVERVRPVSKETDHVTHRPIPLNS